MDVQMENVDPPSCESQPSGKIRKGFKLFGKRKPGNIFSMRHKGDGNNKSPVIRSKTQDGLSETPGADSAQEANNENGQEVSQGDGEQAEEEPICEYGVSAAGPARPSISSTSSVKSLSFLSLLRGGRKGTGNRRVHTLSQPVGRQRLGLKGLFGNVLLRSKDKEEKEEPPPSPLLMSSRSNSVEIIKDDLPLTPKSQPRSLNSLEVKSGESAAMPPSQSDEHVAPLSTPEPPLVPGDNSLSSLLEDISSLLTFESISGGDIMADVEAEWGKASSALSVEATAVTPSFTSLSSKPVVSSTHTSPAVSAATITKPSPYVLPTTAPPQSFTSLTNTTTSPKSKPSTITATFTKSSTLTTDSVKPSMVSSSAYEVSQNSKINSSYGPSTTKPSSCPLTSPNISPPAASSLFTYKSPPSYTSTTTTTTTTLSKPAAPVKVSSTTPISFSTTNKLPSEIATPPVVTSPVTKPSPAASLSKTSVTQSPPVSFGLTQPPPANLEPASKVQTTTAHNGPLSSASGEQKATVSLSSTVATKASSPVQGIAKATPSPALSTSTVSEAITKTTSTSPLVDLNKPPPSHVTGSTLAATTKAQPIPLSVQTQASSGYTETPSMAKPTSAAVSAGSTTQTVFPTPTSLSQVSVSQYKTPTAPSHTSVNDPPAGVKDSTSERPNHNAETPVSVTSNIPASRCLPTSAPKNIPAPVQIPVSQSKAPTAPPASLPLSPAPTVVTPKVLKTEPNNEPQTSVQATPREKKTPQGKSPGLSKIPVVGGGKAGRHPVRDDDSIRDPPTPVFEDVPHFSLTNDGSKNKTSVTGAKSPTSKQSFEEFRPQPKVSSSSARDTKIPVKHSVQSHTPSQTKEPPRTKIPVSKVPVRRAVNKPSSIHNAK
ncbi:mucin-2-like [Gouania willdenowi]|uniref:mucin-2-like n=1 Tax=Gouania willdenowi TaxID=441366 RepID=UPI001056D430|nr:mucin-2-like [Gouania willdenowi]